MTTALVEVYGDSTTVGWQNINGTGYFTKNNVPNILQRMLQMVFGSSVTVTNQGISGTEASDLVNGTNGFPTVSWTSRMASSLANIVVLNFGLNDCFYTKSPKTGIIAEQPSDYASYMSQLVQTAKSAGKQVVVCEPNPTTEPLRAADLPDYVVAMRASVGLLNVPIVGHFDLIQKHPNWQAMLTDGLHPGDLMYNDKACREFCVIAPMVKSILGV